MVYIGLLLTWYIYIYMIYIYIYDIVIIYIKWVYDMGNTKS